MNHLDKNGKMTWWIDSEGYLEIRSEFFNTDGEWNGRLYVLDPDTEVSKADLILIDSPFEDERKGADLHRGECEDCGKAFLQESWRAKEGAHWLCHPCDDAHDQAIYETERELDAMLVRDAVGGMI